LSVAITTGHGLTGRSTGSTFIPSHSALDFANAVTNPKAAVQLGVSQPAVSKVIADLEHALGVRLLDRSPHGVEPTVFGQALSRLTATR
jgi:hypothetical protein